MRKSIVTPSIFVPVAWVKNVYSLRTAWGINSGQLPTDTIFTRQHTYHLVHNSPFIPLLVQVFTPHLSTAKITQSHPLYTRLYPQSTSPITMKKKEKIERNT